MYRLEVYLTVFFSLAICGFSFGDSLCNGSFEQPVVASGSVQNNSGLRGWQAFKIDLLGYGALDGRQAIDLVGSPGLGYIQQTVAAVPGQVVEISFGISSPSTSDPIPDAVRLVVNGNVVATLDALVGYQRFRFEVLAQTPTLKIRFEGLNYLGNWSGPLLDDVRINACVAPMSAIVTSGVLQSGSVGDLQVSDDADLVIRRSTMSTVAEAEVELTSLLSAATVDELEIRLEAAVFARARVNQIVEVFDYDSMIWEEVDNRQASRFVDSTVSVRLTENPNRYVEPNTGEVKARVRYHSLNPRQQFAAHIDQFVWLAEDRNLVCNGSFENKDIAQGAIEGNTTSIWGWSESDVDLMGYVDRVVTGDQSVDLVGSPGLGWVEQTIDVVNGQSYRISFWLRSASVNQSISGAVRFRIDGVSQGVLDAPTSFQKFEYFYTASSNSLVIRFEGRNYLGNWSGPIIDEVSVIEQ